MSNWLNSLNDREIRQIQRDLPSLSRTDLLALRHTLTKHFVSDVLTRLDADIQRQLRKRENDHEQPD